MKNAFWIMLLIVEAFWGVLSDMSPPMKMIVLALITFGVVKWQALRNFSPERRGITRVQTLAWFFLTPTLNPGQFFHAHVSTEEHPQLQQWIGSASNAIMGAILIAAIAPRCVDSAPLLAGWIAMTGMVMVLHFGLLELIVLFWRSQGRDIQSLMKTPLMATSLSDFWGKRWNTAFRDFAHEQVFRPVCRRWSAPLAVWSTFVFSALIHELAISVPAGGGYGLPATYFLLQSAGMKVERMATRSRRWPQAVLFRWMFTAGVIIAPAALLFHSPFIMRVILPLISRLH